MNRVVILGNIPLLPQSGPQCLARSSSNVQSCSGSPETTLTKYNKAEQTVAKESGARDVKSRPGSARRSAPRSSEDTTCTSTRITSPLTIRFFSKECCSRPFESQRIHDRTETGNGDCDLRGSQAPPPRLVNTVRGGAAKGRRPSTRMIAQRHCAEIGPIGSESAQRMDNRLSLLLATQPPSGEGLGRPPHPLWPGWLVIPIPTHSEVQRSAVDTGDVRQIGHLLARGPGAVEP